MLAWKHRVEYSESHNVILKRFVPTGVRVSMQYLPLPLFLVASMYTACTGSQRKGVIDNGLVCWGTTCNKESQRLDRPLMELDKLSRRALLEPRQKANRTFRSSVNGRHGTYGMCRQPRLIHASNVPTESKAGSSTLGSGRVGSRQKARPALLCRI